MENRIIGRKKESEILKQALDSHEAEMVSVIGRRRIGKTFLVTSTYQDKIVFELTGIQNASLKTQLTNFRDVLEESMDIPFPMEVPSDWTTAFRLLKTYLKPKLGDYKKVIFFDELPWLASHKSGFLQAFGYFWNSWASRQNLVVVICGSAASWMIQKVVNNKGGLHNRITQRIELKPFNLSETKQYLQSRNIFFDHYQILQIYMVLGGVPHYLKEIRPGKSAIQNIDEICFSDTGLLKNEFVNLYAALFKNADKHTEVIRALAGIRSGMTRLEIGEQLKLQSGGGLTTILNELEQSGFIASYFPFGKKKRAKLYRLTDEYSLFYLKFMETRVQGGQGTWKHLSQTQTYKSWSGYAFESICLKHLAQIKKALGISGVYALSSTFYKKGNSAEKGAQIDLLLDRNDHVINLFEIKFYNDEWSLTKMMADELKTKKSVFKRYTNTKKQIFWTLITTFDLQHNQHSLGLIDNILTMDVLFEA
ncbi:MAG: ATP-binding protein [Chitinophagales bacterium]